MTQSNIIERALMKHTQKRYQITRGNNNEKNKKKCC